MEQLEVMHVTFAFNTCSIRAFVLPNGFPCARTSIFFPELCQNASLIYRLLCINDPLVVDEIDSLCS